MVYRIIDMIRRKELTVEINGETPAGMMIKYFVNIGMKITSKIDFKVEQYGPPMDMLKVTSEIIDEERRIGQKLALIEKLEKSDMKITTKMIVQLFET